MYATWFHMDDLLMRKREIKFRVYNKAANKWVHPTEKAVNLLGETILFGGFMHGVILEEYNDCVVQQYTGFKDKNGREIFEGDLVNFSFKVEHGEKENFKNYIVVWDSILGMWGVEEDTYVTNKFEFGFNEIAELEVVGNIFENKDKNHD